MIHTRKNVTLEELTWSLRIYDSRQEALKFESVRCTIIHLCQKQYTTNMNGKQPLLYNLQVPKSACLILTSLPNLRLKSTLDSINWSPTPTRLTGHEEDTVFLRKKRIWWFTGFAGDVFDCCWAERERERYRDYWWPDKWQWLTHVAPQHVLNLFLLETTFDNKASCTIDTSCCTHLSKEELDNVFGLWKGYRISHSYIHIKKESKKGPEGRFKMTDNQVVTRSFRSKERIENILGSESGGLPDDASSCRYLWHSQRLISCFLLGKVGVERWCIVF